MCSFGSSIKGKVEGRKVSAIKETSQVCQVCTIYSTTRHY